MPSESEVPDPANRTVVGSRASNGALGVVWTGQLPDPSTFQPGCPGAGTKTRPDPLQPLSWVACAAAAPSPISTPLLAPAASSMRPMRLMDVLPLVMDRPDVPRQTGFRSIAYALGDYDRQRGRVVHRQPAADVALRRRAALRDAPSRAPAAQGDAGAVHRPRARGGVAGARDARRRGGGDRRAAARRGGGR